MQRMWALETWRLAPFLPPTAGGAVAILNTLQDRLGKPSLARTGRGKGENTAVERLKVKPKAGF